MQITIFDRAGYESRMKQCRSACKILFGDCRPITGQRHHKGRY